MESAAWPWLGLLIAPDTGTWHLADHIGLVRPEDEMVGILYSHDMRGRHSRLKGVRLGRSRCTIILNHGRSGFWIVVIKRTEIVRVSEDRKNRNVNLGVFLSAFTHC
jgi:hypothetical protein